MGDMTLLSRDAIFGASDIRTRMVEIPEWGGTVRVRGLSGTERDQFEQSVMATNKNGSTRVNLVNVRARLVAMTVVDESGQRVFQDTDIPMLGTKSSSALDRIYEVATALSGIGDRDVEELLGN